MVVYMDPLGNERFGVFGALHSTNPKQPEAQNAKPKAYALNLKP